VGLEPIRREFRQAERGRCLLSHEYTPERFCFHHLSPRLTRLGIEEAGLSSRGVTVSQSIAALNARLSESVLGPVAASSSPGSVGSRRANARPDRQPSIGAPFTGTKHGRGPRSISSAKAYPEPHSPNWTPSRSPPREKTSHFRAARQRHHRASSENEARQT